MLRKLYPGLEQGLKGFNGRYVVASSGPGIPSSIAAIYDSSDPMQSLINGLENSTSPATLSKPDYMWMGNGASGAVEVGGSGFDLVASGVTQEQSSSNMGAGNFTVFDANTESLINTADASLQPGSGSFAAVWAGDLTDNTSIRYLFGDRDDTTNDGWVCYHGNGANYFFYMEWDDGSGSVSTTVVAASSTGPQVIIVARDATNATADISTPAGDQQSTSVAAKSCNAQTQEFGLGDVGPAAAARMEFGVFGYWLGAPAEAIAAAISTYRQNLATNLSFA